MHLKLVGGEVLEMLMPNPYSFVVKRVVIALSVITLAYFTSNSFAANASIKSGDSCKTLGITKIVSKKKFICVRKGSKLVWNIGVNLNKNVKPKQIMESNEETVSKKDPSELASSFKFSNICDKDPFVPLEWKEVENFLYRSDIFGCARGPLRYKLIQIPSTAPTTQITPRADLNDVAQCKLTHGKRPVGQIAFSSDHSPQIVLNKRFNIQVVPVEFTDYPSKDSVAADHNKYFQFIKDGYFNLSDGQVNIDFRVPRDYFKVGKRIDSYVLPGRISAGGEPWNWPNMNMSEMFVDIANSFGSDIDFSDVDLVFIVVPPNTNNDYIGHVFTSYPKLNTPQGQFSQWYFSPPMSMVNKKSWYGVNPWLHLHELQHAMYKLDDHYGDGEFGRKDGDAGVGNWSHMSGAHTDFLFWEKWITHMVSDEQVRCANTNFNSIHWLKPSNYFGKEEKLLVVPVDATKVLVVESMRAAGYNFKIPEIAEGALVYLVDLSKTGHGRGINVLRPSNRKGTIYEVPNFVLADAPLKLNESIVSNGFRISVVETGNFGDVIKVEKL